MLWRSASADWQKMPEYMSRQAVRRGRWRTGKGWDGRYWFFRHGHKGSVYFTDGCALDAWDSGR